MSESEGKTTGKRVISDRFKFILPQRSTSVATKPQQLSHLSDVQLTIQNNDDGDVILDQKSVELLQCMQECENYFHECEEFLEMAKANVDKVTNRPKKFIIGAKFREWRAKMTGNNLMHSYDSLAHRGDDLETRLNSVIESNLQGCSSLSFQAHTLQSRLQSCIDYNQERSTATKPKMETLTVMQQQFSSYRNSVLQMISFFDEIQQQKDNSYVPWALRQVQELHDKEHPDLIMKRTELEEEFEKVQKIVEILEGLSKQHEPEFISNTQCVGVGLYTLSDLKLQLKDTSVWLTKQHPKQKAVAAATAAYLSSKNNTQQESNSGKVSQNNPILFKTFQNPILKSKKTSSPSEVNTLPVAPSQSLQGEDKVTSIDTIFPILPPYDHNECKDCTCVLDMAEKCSSHLSTKLNSIEYLIDFLEKLQKLRQEVYEEEKVLESIDWSQQNHTK